MNQTPSDSSEFVPPACKICGNAAVFLGTTRNPQTATHTLHHCRCGTCGLVFVGDAISNEELSAAYGSFDQDDYYEQIRDETLRKFDSAIVDLRRMATPESRILDVGTGNGGFLERLLEQGFRDVSGQEIPGAKLAHIEQRGCKVYYDMDYSTVPDAAFDIVTLLDVAEHVRDPHRLFGACNRVLRAGGTVYFHTPVVTPLDRVVHRFLKRPLLGRLAEAWQRGRTSVFHLQNYTPDALTRVLTQAGFGTVKITVKNELSWPVSGYVKVFVCQKFGLPDWLAPILAPLFAPILASQRFNPNKAIVAAKKTTDARANG